MPENKTYYSGRLSLLVAVLGFASFTALGIWLVLSRSWLNQNPRAWVLPVYLAFFGLLTLYGIAKLVQRNGPDLELSPAGFRISIVGGAIFIPWVEIKKVSEFGTGKNRTIILELADATMSGLRSNFWRRVHLRLTVNADLNAVVVPSRLNVSTLDELKAEIEMWWREYRGDDFDQSTAKTVPPAPPAASPTPAA